MHNSLENKVAVITGAYGDIGFSICEKFAENGINLAILGKDLKKLKLKKKYLNDNYNVDIFSCNLDVSDPDSYKICIEKIISKFEKIDILVNNAGVTKDNIILRMSNEDWNNVIETNLKGTFLGCKYVSKIMVKQKYGKIINISSIVGQIGNKGQTNYVASKAGIDGITKSLAKELGSRGININSIAPGYIETNMTKLLNDNIKKELLDKISLNRFGQPIEVANLAYFLVTEEASYINGQIINLDGGM
tara:strand:+ start:5597 stop:6340 length:744 start_codon:yes stop_codon:yes gene_type:complete